MELFIKVLKHVEMVMWTLICIGCHNQDQFLFIFKSVKKILILDAIPNANLEIGCQKMIGNTIALNANHSTIQQSHVEFCCLIKCFWTLWITTN